MKKLIVVLAALIIMSACVFAAQYHSVPIDDDVYRLIDAAVIRGAVSRQPDVRPYNVNVVRDLLNEMLSQFENGEIMDNDDIQRETEELFPEGASLNTFVGDLNNLLNTRVVPFLLACETDSDYENQIALFYKFMKNYPEQRDIKLIDGAIRELRRQSDNQGARRLLELGCKKVNAIYNEDIKGAEEINQEIAAI